MSLTIESSVQIANPLSVSMEVGLAVIDKPVPVEQLTVAPSTATVEYYPSSGHYFDKVTANAVTSEIDSNIQPLNIREGVTILGVEGNLLPDKPDQSKTVYPSTEQQVVVADTGFELAEVIVEPMILQEKIVEPTVGGQDIVADTGYDALSKVTLEPLALQSKEVTPTKLTQNVTADSGYVGLSGVQVNPIPNEYVDTSGGTITPETVANGYIGYSQGNEIVGTATLAEDTCCGEFEARYCFFDKYGKYQIINKFAGIGGTFSKPTTPIGDVPENVGYNPALTFQGWNYEDTSLQNVVGDLEVGAIYIPTDSKTHIYCTFNNLTGMSPTFYFEKTVGCELSIDWGDNSSIYTTTSSGYLNTTHTYSTYGDYEIKFWISDGVGTYSFGNNTSNTTILGNNTSTYKDCLNRIYFGANVSIVRNYSFMNAYNLTHFSMSNLITTIGTNSIYESYSLNTLIFPQICTSFSGSFAKMKLCFLSFSANCKSGSFFSTYNPFQYTCLNKFVYNGSLIGNSMFYNNYYIDSVNYTGNISVLSSSMFVRCFAKKITLPSTWNNTSINALSSLWALKIFVVQSIVPPTLTELSINNTCKIYVPQASLSDYQTATNWANYASQMVGY